MHLSFKRVNITPPTLFLVSPLTASVSKSGLGNVIVLCLMLNISSVAQRVKRMNRCNSDLVDSDDEPVKSIQQDAFET